MTLDHSTSGPRCANTRVAGAADAPDASTPSWATWPASRIYGVASTPVLGVRPDTDAEHCEGGTGDEPTPDDIESGGKGGKVGTGAKVGILSSVPHQLSAGSASASVHGKGGTEAEPAEPAPRTASGRRPPPRNLQHAGPWEVLGVAHDASAEEIHSAYQQLSLECLFESPSEIQAAKSDLLETAYDAIMESYKVRSGRTAAPVQPSPSTSRTSNVSAHAEGQHFLQPPGSWTGNYRFHDEEIQRAAGVALEEGQDGSGHSLVNADGSLRSINDTADTSPTQLPTPASAAESIAAEALAPDEFEC